MSNNNASNQAPSFTILVKAGGNRVEGLTIEHVNESEDPSLHESTVSFLTRAGKRWKMKLSEFSFVFPSTIKAA